MPSRDAVGRASSRRWSTGSAREVEERTDQLGVLEALLLQTSTNRKFLPTLHADRRRLVLVELRLPDRSVHRPDSRSTRASTFPARSRHADRRRRERQGRHGGMARRHMVKCSRSITATASSRATRTRRSCCVQGRRSRRARPAGRDGGIDGTLDGTAPAFRGAAERRAAEPGPFLAAARADRANLRATAHCTSRGVRRSSPLVFCARRHKVSPKRPLRRDDLQHPHPHLRQPQRAAAQAVRPGGPRRSTRSSRRSPRCPTKRCAAKTAELKRQRVADGAALDDVLPEAFAVVREAGKRTLQHAPLRRAADRRHGAAQRQDRRNAHRRRQDARRHAARVPECARRQGRAHRHGQRLPRAARRRLDGAHLQVPRPDRRRQPVADAARGQAGRLRRRHHLRHQQRVRLRLPARQHGVRAERARAARARSTRSSTRSTRS